MGSTFIVRQGYRLYAAMLVIWGGWSLAWGLFSIEMSPTTIGSGWLLIAGIGVPVTVGLYLSRVSVFDTTTLDIAEFRANSFTGAPLVAYAGLLVVWSVVFTAWWTGVFQGSAGTVAVSTVVGYGWLTIAGYGAALTIGLVSTHRAEVLDAVGVRTIESERI